METKDGNKDEDDIAARLAPCVGSGCMRNVRTRGGFRYGFFYLMGPRVAHWHSPNDQIWGMPQCVFRACQAPEGTR